jgi:hypothetical protein
MRTTRNRSSLWELHWLNQRSTHHKQHRAPLKDLSLSHRAQQDESSEVETIQRLIDEPFDLAGAPHQFRVIRRRGLAQPE